MVRSFVIGVHCLILSTGVVAYAQRGERGAPQAPKPDNAQSLAHLETAKKIAGSDSFLANPYNFFCVAGNARAQNNNAPDLDPIKVFDNLYAVGNSETAVYALTSSEGILLLDAGFENKAEQHKQATPRWLVRRSSRRQPASTAIPWQVHRQMGVSAPI